jgi:hypothetical protein
MSNIVTRHNIDEILEEASSLLIRKNTDYGDAWKRSGIIGLLVRLGDKLTRVENLNGRRALVADETIRDTLIDIIGYAVLALIVNDKSDE